MHMLYFAQHRIPSERFVCEWQNIVSALGGGGMTIPVYGGASLNKNLSEM
jgi:hypothetical protein